MQCAFPASDERDAESFCCEPGRDRGTNAGSGANDKEIRCWRLLRIRR
jgi:hypothetical protein